MPGGRRVGDGNAPSEKVRRQVWQRHRARAAVPRRVPSRPCLRSVAGASPRLRWGLAGEMLFETSKDHDGARAPLRRVLEKQPDDVEANALLGKIELSAGRAVRRRAAICRL